MLKTSRNYRIKKKEINRKSMTTYIYTIYCCVFIRSFGLFWQGQGQLRYALSLCLSNIFLPINARYVESINIITRSLAYALSLSWLYELHMQTGQLHVLHDERERGGEMERRLSKRVYGRVWKGRSPYEVRYWHTHGRWFSTYNGCWLWHKKSKKLNHITIGN